MSSESNGQEGLDLEPLGQKPTESTSPRMLVPLFVVPLLIVVVIVAVFLTFNVLVGGEATAEQLVSRIESGGVNDRWQAANALADMVVRHPEEVDQPELVDRIRRSFEQSGPRGTKMRRYLVEVLGQLDDRACVPLVHTALRNSLEAEKSGAITDENLITDLGAEIIHYVRVLGRLGDETVLETLRSLRQHPDKAYRLTVAAALGDFYYGHIQRGEPLPAIGLEDLKELHQDEDPWVRFNAALSLAKVGQADGISTLEFMLDRANLRRNGLQYPDSGAYTVNHHDPAVEPISYALAAIRSLASQHPDLLGGEGPLLVALRRLSEEDPSDLLRQRARDVLADLGKAPKAASGA